MRQIANASNGIDAKDAALAYGNKVSHETTVEVVEVFLSDIAVRARPRLLCEGHLEVGEVNHVQISIGIKIKAGTVVSDPVLSRTSHATIKCAKVKEVHTAVGVAIPGLIVNQKPPVSSKRGADIFPVSCCPIVPESSKTPSTLVEVRPPPSMVYKLISYVSAPAKAVKADVKTITKP